MNLIQATTVFTLMFHLCSAQVFPFSNLRAFFDKNKQGRDAVGISSSGTNVSRPHRQANHDAHLPALPEFDSPDIFTINKDIEDERGTTVKRHPSSPDTSSGRKGIGRHRINTKLNVGQPHEDSDGAIFITPKPNSEYTEYGSSAEDYSKIRSKNRIRKRKPQTVQVEPDVQHSHHVPSDKRLSGFQHSGNPVQPSPETSFTSDGTYVESIPSLAIAIEDDFQKPKVNNGLVDYLVPPKHPSVYEKALKLSKTRKPHSPGVAKLKSPAPTGLSKKESRFRPKKHREQNVPLTERTIKRQAPRRRPAHPREPQRKPVRKPPVESVATQMDEQITSETGFTVVGALHGGGAGAGSHGDERVEFQMHGQKGPHSYKFGYDTGKGHNRQFRFEEKDNHGRVKGHYGYYDKDGKLQIVNYEADPHTGFKAETV